MNKAVFIAWRGGGEANGHWSPVAQLEHADGDYRFVYTRGALALPGFQPFPGMPDLEEVYYSEALFPLLANRLLARSRPEYQAWLRWSDFDPADPPDPLAILGVTEGIRQTDAVEVFPRPVPDALGGYRSRFFLHGLRHASEVARDRIAAIQPGDRIEIEVEDDNPFDPQITGTEASIAGRRRRTCRASPIRCRWTRSAVSPTQESTRSGPTFSQLARF